MEIGKRLRMRREEIHMSRTQLSQKVHVTPSAIANYENGISTPKPDILVSLLLALDVDANYIFQDYVPSPMLEKKHLTCLSSRESTFLTQYRQLPEPSKDLLHLILEREYQQMIQEKHLTEYPCLFPSPRQLEQGFLLIEEIQTIRLYQKQLPEGTDFCLHVSSDRYLPFFKKKDILALSKTPAEHNQLGLFLVDQVYHIRLLSSGDTTSLLPLNLTEPELIITPDTEFSCIGTILDKVYGDFTLI